MALFRVPSITYSAVVRTPGIPRLIPAAARVGLEATMQFRNSALIIAAVLTSATASFAATGDPCVVADFDPSCNGDGTIQLCDAQTAPNAPVEAAFTCADALGTGDSCTTTPGCDGDCADLGIFCESAIGGGCIGLGVLFTEDQTDDDFIGTVGCEDGATCSVGVVDGAAVDSCVAHIGPQCTAGGEASSCTGTVWTTCLGDQAGTFALTTNLALDCSIIGTTCGQQPCECDAQCGSSGTCANGFCDTGVGCVTDAADLPACGTTGGEGEGEAGGEGEGEDGTGGGRRDEEPEEEPASGCASANLGGASFAGLMLALVAVRRRRR